MLRFDPLRFYLFEQQGDDSGKRFAGIAPAPPTASDAIADMKFFRLFVPADDGDGSNRFSQLFRHDGPLVERRVLVLADPAV